jgi:hypothetical protein
MSDSTPKTVVISPWCSVAAWRSQALGVNVQDGFCAMDPKQESYDFVSANFGKSVGCFWPTMEQAVIIVIIITIILAIIITTNIIIITIITITILIIVIVVGRQWSVSSRWSSSRVPCRIVKLVAGVMFLGIRAVSYTSAGEMQAGKFKGIDPQICRCSRNGE